MLHVSFPASLSLHLVDNGRLLQVPSTVHSPAPPAPTLHSPAPPALLQVPATHQLQLLWKQFGDLPGAATVARLAGVVPLGKEWSRRATDWLRARVLGRDLVSLVAGLEGGVAELVLVDTGEEGEDKYIGSEMVNQGLASRKI